jgi:hypothetical protein
MQLFVQLYATPMPTAGDHCHLLLRSQLFACSREARAMLPNLASTLQVNARNSLEIRLSNDRSNGA